MNEKRKIPGSPSGPSALKKVQSHKLALKLFAL